MEAYAPPKHEGVFKISRTSARPQDSK